MPCRRSQRGYAALAIEIRGFGERRDRRPAALREPGCASGHARSERHLQARGDGGSSARPHQSWREDPGHPTRARCAGPLPRGRRSSRSTPSAIRAAARSPGTPPASRRAWKGLMLGSCFSTYAASIGSVDHCCDNYLPGALRWFDFPDLALSVAPRPLVVVMGARRPPVPASRRRDCLRTRAGDLRGMDAADRCRLVVCRRAQVLCARSLGCLRRDDGEPACLEDARTEVGSGSRPTAAPAATESITAGEAAVRPRPERAPAPAEPARAADALGPARLGLAPHGLGVPCA